jgi:hypothetical protein
VKAVPGKIPISPSITVPTAGTLVIVVAAKIAKVARAPSATKDI